MDRKRTIKREQSSLPPQPSSDNEQPSPKRRRLSFSAATDDVDSLIEQKRELIEEYVDDSALLLSVAFSAVIKNSEWAEKLNPRFESYKECRKAIQNHKDLSKCIKECAKKWDWNALFELSLFQKPLLQSASIHLKEQLRPTSEPYQKQATVDSWKKESFMGKGLNALIAHIEHHTDPEISKDYYGNFCAIIQSSGMGKSRLVDEFSRKHIVIPINLRPSGSQGFPPADRRVRSYFSEPDGSISLSQLVCRFLEALFVVAKSVIKSLKVPVAKRAVALREYFAKGMDFDSHGEQRQSFYNQVIDFANKKIDHSRMLKGGPVCASTVTAAEDKHAVEAALKALLAAVKVPQSKTVTPLVFLSFDEAHTLSDCRDHNENSLMTELRRVFNHLKAMQLFAFFLSTTGKISSLVSTHHPDASARLQLGTLRLLPAFSDLGFDLLALKNKIGKNKHTLAQITAVTFMANFGRPMWGLRAKYFQHPSGLEDDLLKFAGLKLLNTQTPKFSKDQKLACLSIRLALEFNSTTYFDIEQEHTQVEGHLRICLQIDESSNAMTSLSPSEPLVAEAAAQAMKEFDPVQAMQEVFSGFSIHQGDRGELLVMLLLTLARDKATKGLRPPILGVSQLFIELFAQSGPILSMKPSISPYKSRRSFEQTFRNAGTHFNHFIKVHQWNMCGLEELLLLMQRGAFVLCATGQPGIDLCGAGVLDQSKVISEDNCFVILAQVKNDPKYTEVPKLELFDVMDPFELGIFDRANPRSTVRFIRIVFALASPKAEIVPIDHRQPVSGNFVSYDIWCAGITPSVLLPVGKRNRHIWNGLLNASRKWVKLYDTNGNKAAQACRRRQNPGAANDKDHWKQWCSRKSQVC